MISHLCHVAVAHGGAVVISGWGGFLRLWELELEFEEAAYSKGERNVCRHGICKTGSNDAGDRIVRE